MNYVEAVLAAKAWREGRAQRSALLRHRHISKKPLGMLLWQLGAEPFTAAAVAWGFGPRRPNIAVPGEPRDRDLAFRALTQVAREFNGWFESNRDELHQLVVPNRGNLSLLARLGRRLSYLPTDGDQPADPDLVRFGRHLRFIGDRSKYPGQQAILVLTDLISSHWVTGLSELENHSLPALDAAIDPGGTSGHQAAVAAERIEIGPAPSETDDARLDRLVTDFNAVRGRRTAEALVGPLRQPIRDHYSALVDRGWSLLWCCLQRERGFQEGAHVERRLEEDIEAQQRHLEWIVDRALPYRTRQTHVQAARTVRSWEDAHQAVNSEEAIDDPLRMAPYYLSNEAISGRVISVDLEHRAIARKTMVRRPLLKLEINVPCLMPEGKDLYWIEAPEAAPYQVQEVSWNEKLGRGIVTLQNQTSREIPRPKKGQSAVFSTHHLHTAPPLMLPKKAPWTHRSIELQTSDIEDAVDGRGWE